MHLLDQRILGIVILFLLAMLVIAKRMATGSILDKPKGNLMVQLVNIFNLFLLLVVNPAAALLLITRRLEAFDPTHLTVEAPWLLMVLEIVGLVAYVTGFFLMAWEYISCVIAVTSLIGFIVIIAPIIVAEITADVVHNRPQYLCIRFPQLLKHHHCPTKAGVTRLDNHQHSVHLCA